MVSRGFKSLNLCLVCNVCTLHVSYYLYGNALSASEKEG